MNGFPHAADFRANRGGRAMTTKTKGRRMMDITPRERFPSGSCIAIDFPPPSEGVRSRTIWIDGNHLKHAHVIIRQFEAGSLTEREAENALYDLAYAPPSP
jgi:hypothetical protein